MYSGDELYGDEITSGPTTGDPFDGEACTDQCERERCFDCGACPEHCQCDEGFVRCECVRIDVDQDDARDCRAHGPSSQLARELKRREALHDNVPGWPYGSGDGDAPF